VVWSALDRDINPTTCSETCLYQPLSSEVYYTPTAERFQEGISDHGNESLVKNGCPLYTVNGEEIR
jgi:hypothetical protein